MARISSADDYQEIEKKLSQMEAKLKKSKRFFSCFNCLIYFLILILLFFGLLAYVLAKSGLVDVPIFTKIFFQEPQPRYLVADWQGQSLHDYLQLQLQEQVQTGFLQRQEDQPAILVLPEEVLSAEVRRFLQRNNSAGQNNLELAQISIQSDSLEFYAHWVSPNIYLTLVLVPFFENGQLKFQTLSFKLGDLPLPKWLGSFILNRLVGDTLESLNKLYSSFGEVQGVTLRDGHLAMKVLFKKSLILDVFK